MPPTAPSPRTHVPPIVAEIGAKGDFPATGRVVQRLRETVGRENCTALDIARIIMQDPGFSSKVLRLVNSAFYRQRGNPVSTVSRAVILLGFGAIRDLTMGLMLIEEFARKGRASEYIRDEVRRALFCGLLSQAIASRIGYPSIEEAYLLGLFANLGPLWLSTFYPTEHRQAWALVEERRIPFARAMMDVTGAGPAELAAAILEHWNFPPNYAAYFRRPHAGERLTAVSGGDRLAAIVDLAAEHAAGKEDAPPTAELVARFHALFSLAPDALLAGIAAATEGVREQGSLLGLPSKATEADVAPPSQAPDAQAAPPADPRRVALPAETALAALDIVAEITHSMLEREAPGDTLSVVLEGIARIGHYDLVLLTVLDPTGEMLVGQMAYGEAAEHVKGLAVPLQAEGGLLADTAIALAPRLVPQGTAAALVPHGAPVPRVPAGAFATYPLATRGRVLGVLLATRTKGAAIDDADLALIRLLCQEASLVLDHTAG